MGYEANPAGAPDGFNPKFTGQVRDVESGLDYFNARYYSPEQGRFVSADPGNAGSDPSDPQTWNGYAYVSGNPLALTDPSGMGLGDFLEGLIDGIVGTVANAVTGGLWGALTDQHYSPAGVGMGAFGAPDVGFGGGDTEPWSEQLPITGGFGGSLSTGTVFGSGNAGPFINNILQTAGGNPGDLIFYAQALAYLQRDPTMARIIRQLQGSRRVYTVSFIGNGNDSYLRGGVSWDPTSSLQLVPGGGCQSAALGLGHELAHAYEEDLYPYWYAREHGIPSPAYGNQVERWAIVGAETSAARTLGEPMRRNHGGNVMRERNTTARTCQVPIP
jgi:RHS repeat-associated protein